MARQYPIFITNPGANNAQVVIKWSLVLFVFNWLSHWLFLDEISIINMFLYGLVIAGLLLGFFKFTEPEHALKLTQNGFYYFHRRGEVYCPWSNVLRIDIPNLSEDFDGGDLNLIGIRFREPEEFYQSIPLRLASRILVEQRPLWFGAAKQSCQSGTCVPEEFIDSVEHKSDAGTHYKGLIAMFVYRYELLARLLGFQLYIPVSSCDESIYKLLNLLKEVKKESDRLDFDPLP